MERVATTVGSERALSFNAENVYMHPFLPVRLPVCLPACLSVYPSTDLSICLSLCLYLNHGCFKPWFLEFPFVSGLRARIEDPSAAVSYSQQIVGSGALLES